MTEINRRIRKCEGRVAPPTPTSPEAKAADIEHRRRIHRELELEWAGYPTSMAALNAGFIDMAEYEWLESDQIRSYGPDGPEAIP